MIAADHALFERTSPTRRVSPWKNRTPRRSKRFDVKTSQPQKNTSSQERQTPPSGTGPTGTEQYADEAKDSLAASSQKLFFQYRFRLFSR
jgi:hypothetical protein